MLPTRHGCEGLTLDQRTVIDICTDLSLMPNFTLHSLDMATEGVTLYVICK